MVGFACKNLLHTALLALVVSCCEVREPSNEIADSTGSQGKGKSPVEELRNEASLVDQDCPQAAGGFILPTYYMSTDSVECGCLSKEFSEFLLSVENKEDLTRGMYEVYLPDDLFDKMDTVIGVVHFSFDSCRGAKVYVRSRHWRSLGIILFDHGGNLTDFRIFGDAFDTAFAYMPRIDDDNMDAVARATVASFDSTRIRPITDECFDVLKRISYTDELEIVVEDVQ